MARAAQSGPSIHSLSTLQVGSTQEDSEAPTHVLGSEPPPLVSMLPWDRGGTPIFEGGCLSKHLSLEGKPKILL